MEHFIIYRCDGSDGGCNQISDTLNRLVGKTCPFCRKGTVEAVDAYIVYGNSGQYTVIPADDRDDRPWQMRG